MTLTLCPPAIAAGANCNLMTRLQVQRERRNFELLFGRELRLEPDWIDELNR